MEVDLIGQLTSGERDLAGAVLIFMAIVGIAMAAVGGSEPLGIHGVMVLFYSCGLLFILMRSAFGAPPDPARFGKYYDDPIKVGVGFTLAWAIFGCSSVSGRPPSLRGRASTSIRPGQASAVSALLTHPA